MRKRKKVSSYLWAILSVLSQNLNYFSLVFFSMCVMALRLVGNTEVLHSHQQPWITMPLSTILLQCPELPSHLMLNLALNKQGIWVVALLESSWNKDKQVCCFFTAVRWRIILSYYYFLIRQIHKDTDPFLEQHLDKLIVHPDLVFNSKVPSWNSCQSLSLLES